MSPQELQVQEKKELSEKTEKTEAGRYYAAPTDIYETSDALFITMDMPGVQKDQMDINLEKNILTVSGKIDFSNYKDLKPIYTEYNIGNFSRSFTLSSEIDKDNISAKVDNGVLELYLPKHKGAAAKKIEIQ